MKTHYTFMLAIAVTLSTLIASAAVAPASAGGSGVGQLVWKGVGNKCTFFSIHVEAVITAAHCLFDPKSGRRAKPSELILFINGARHKVDSIRVSDDYEYVPPSEDNFIASTDRAIMTVLPVLPGALRLSTPSADELRTRPLKAAAVTSLASPPSFADCQFIHKPGATVEKQMEVGVGFVDCGGDVQPGWSGGPVLMETEAGWCAIGILSGCGVNKPEVCAFAMFIDDRVRSE